MNESPGSTTMVDSTDGNNGTFSATGVKAEGGFYTFDGTGAIDVPNAGNLNPGTEPFSFGVMFRTTAIPGTGQFDFDVMRKGLDGSHPLYKWELLPSTNGTGAVATCVFQSEVKGGRVVKDGVKLGKTLNDGNWHAITCARTSNGISITIDSTSCSKTLRTGSISNTDDFIVGEKAANDDEYIGDLKAGWFAIG